MMTEQQHVIEITIPWVKQPDISTTIYLEPHDDNDHQLMMSDRMDCCYAWLTIDQLKDFHTQLGQYINHFDTLPAPTVSGEQP